MFNKKLPDRFVFGIRLKELMKKSGIKQIELANLIGVERSRLSHYINGRYEPDIAVLAAISSVMNTSIDYLIGMTNTMALAGFNNTEKNFSSLVWQRERPLAAEGGNIVTWIPVYESRFSPDAGICLGLSDSEADDIEDSVEPVGWVRGWTKVGSSSGWDYNYMLVATDETMSPYIIKGDLLCVEQLAVDDIGDYPFRTGAVYVVKQNESETIGLTLKLCCLRNDSLLLTAMSSDILPVVYDIRTLAFNPVVGRVSTILRRPFN